MARTKTKTIGVTNAPDGAPMVAPTKPEPFDREARDRLRAVPVLLIEHRGENRHWRRHIAPLRAGDPVTNIPKAGRRRGTNDTLVLAYRETDGGGFAPDGYTKVALGMGDRLTNPVGARRLARAVGSR